MSLCVEVSELAVATDGVVECGEFFCGVSEEGGT